MSVLLVLLSVRALFEQKIEQNIETLKKMLQKENVKA